MADKTSFVMYYMWGDVFENLPPEKAGELIQAIYKYQRTGTISIDDPVLSAVFEMIRIKMDEDGEKYQKKVELNRENGKKGGRPKNPKNPDGFSETQNNPVGFSETEPNPEKPDNDTDTDNDIDNDIVINIDIPARPKKPKPKKHRYGEFNNVLLSDEEFEKLGTLGVDVPDYIERLSGYMESKKKSYASHYATLRNWIRKDKQNESLRKKQSAASSNPFLELLMEEAEKEGG